MDEVDLDVSAPQPEDLEEAATIAAQALLDSPPYRHVCSEGTDSATREAFLKFLFLRNFRMAIGYGCCRGAYETSKSDDGGADKHELVCFFMFVPQQGGLQQPGLCDMLRAGIFGSVLRFGLGPTLGLVRITRWAEQIEQEILKGRKVIRLEGMVVKPSRQSMGIGTRAIGPALEEADSLGLEVFLATQDERSLAFYHRLGFRVMHEATYEPGGFVSWFMLRAPGGATAGAP
mmetsp:Transcript_168782/g.536669  ORF Transcript_168782/g.536669 Transcript_168782/m.536669 type:complete len:232 (+) Transcript_168782:76-771(+)